MAEDSTQFPVLQKVETAPDELVSPHTQPLKLKTTISPTPGLAHRTNTASSDPETPFSPVRRRADSRANTFRAVDDYDDIAFDFESHRPGWQPGSEPGYDPSKPDGGHASVPALHAECEITVADFDEGRVESRSFGNEDFIEYLQRPQPAWSKCRWININGLSWDVIQACGQHKGLHKLAIEDIMNTRNRTKTDCKGLHAGEEVDERQRPGCRSHEGLCSQDRPGEGFVPAKTAHMSRRDRVKAKLGFSVEDPDLTPDDSILVRTLQRYHASPNEARTDYMEKHSSLNSRDLAVSAEQVSIFLTSDNTVISFFEVSARDIERPIALRLSTPGTILRQSCDASLLVQAIIDAIIDLALPLTAVYQDVIGDLELDVLTSPSIKQSRQLYICISEINKMLTFLNPIDNVVNVLRDHATDLRPDIAARELHNPASGVIVTPLTHTYLGDVLDHCVIITEAMEQIKRSADNLIDLIFNTISANQNESMKQLTVITIIFLPLTFITGYFGQNFEPFPQLAYGIPYFWKIAAPVVCITVTVMMQGWIRQWITKILARRQIVAARKRGQRKRRKQA
ncbi:conserved hypothetical protein [Verticillium alfalfae VaMs.102]|uniref:Magnesium and cobalt transporter CorA n=1 Tax=Verticillium alfalfae (strain VaMs.102 / ATCC MYA-4576 / FGSC 10136) TaxID=526221 RepID=C9SS13_VERA1|nr:conserved hypothetical protein [Verticillium alfalfae VaMs.102]EEY21578.1 conserved hypothetical protein [Verticillium alfalfae VaMs.102]